jgi:hypothetical protein
MKTYSANVANVIDSDSLSPYFLVKLDFKSGSVYHTNTPMDVTVAGFGTFDSDNALLGIDSPRLSSVVDREAYKITYSDNDFVFRTRFEEGIIGTPVTVYIGFYNTSNSVIDGVLPGSPFTNLDDLVIAYKGFIDSHGYAADTEGQVTAVLECTSPMSSLDLTKPFYTSRDSMRQINVSDTSFDDVYSGSKAINLLWGKK